MIEGWIDKTWWFVEGFADYEVSIYGEVRSHHRGVRLLKPMHQITAGICA